MSGGYNVCKAHGGGNNERALFQRSVISKLSRVELEDKFYRAIESNVLLKREGHLQEERLRQLGARVGRLQGLLRREEVQGLAYRPLENLVRNQETRINELEKQNRELQQKIGVLKKMSSIQQYQGGLGVGRGRGRHRTVLSDSEGGYSEQPASNKDTDRTRKSVSIESSPSKSHTEQQTSPKEASRDTTGREVTSEDNVETAVSMENVDSVKMQKTEENCDNPMDEKSNAKLLRSSYVQTDVSVYYYDDMSKKLSEKESIICDLQNQLKVMAVRQNLLEEMDQLLDIIHKKSKSDVSKKKKKVVTVKKPEGRDGDMERILQELEMEKYKTQKKINTQLVEKLVEQQRQIDHLHIQTRNRQHNQCSSCMTDTNRIMSANINNKEKEHVTPREIIQETSRDNAVTKNNSRPKDDIDSESDVEPKVKPKENNVNSNNNVESKSSINPKDNVKPMSSDTSNVKTTNIVEPMSSDTSNVKTINNVQPKNDVKTTDNVELQNNSKPVNNVKSNNIVEPKDNINAKDNNKPNDGNVLNGDSVLTHQDASSHMIVHPNYSKIGNTVGTNDDKIGESDGEIKSIEEMQNQLTTKDFIVNADQDTSDLRLSSDKPQLKAKTSTQDIQTLEGPNTVPPEVVFQRESELDDATYSVSEDSMSSSGPSLSDGEVPRGGVRDEEGKSEGQVNTTRTEDQYSLVDLSLLEYAALPVQERAELTLKAISEQLDTCRMLITAPYKI